MRVSSAQAGRLAAGSGILQAGQQRQRLLAHSWAWASSRDPRCRDSREAPLQRTAQLLLQALLQTLGLGRVVELLPAMIERGGLDTGHQQQDEGREGGKMGNFTSDSCLNHAMGASLIRSDGVFYDSGRASSR